MQFQRKLMIQTWENDRKPSFGSNFSSFWSKFGPQKCFLWILSLLDIRHCCKLPSLYEFFFNLALSVTRGYGQLSCTISEKTNDPILRKLSDGRKDGQTDRQMDKSDFVGRCSVRLTSSVQFRYCAEHKPQMD